MKKITALFLSAVCSLAICAPVLSGCGDDGVKFTLSEEGGKHYIVSYSGYSSPTGEYEIPAYYGEGENYAPVTEIAHEGFSSTNYSKIIVPATVTKIGNAAFSFCYSLERVEFEEGIKLDKINHGMFGSSTALQEIKIPDSVKTIEGLAFYECTSLSSVTMNFVETIGVRAFDKCRALEEISLPSTLKTIGTLAFSNSGLKSISIPESVCDTKKVDDGGNESVIYGLGYASFLNCVNLESVKIANGVETIPSGTFGCCTALKEVYLPLSIKEIQGVYSEKGVPVYGHAFYYDDALQDIYYEGSEEQWKDIKIDYTLFESYVNNDAIKNARKHYN